MSCFIKRDLTCLLNTNGMTISTCSSNLKYLNISQGSLEEVRYYLILAADLGYGNSDKLSDDLDIVSKMLEGYMSSIRKSILMKVPQA